MKPNTLPFAIAGVAAVVWLGSWWMLPYLQDDQTDVNQRAALELERARRILHEYSAGLDYKSNVLGQLRDLEIDVDAGDVDALLDSAQSQYESFRDELWERFSPTDQWGSKNPRPARVAQGNPSGQIREGIGDRDEVLHDNAARLRDALSAVDQALSIREGDSSSADYAEGLRLKALIHHMMGLRNRVRAELIAAQIPGLLGKLSELAVLGEAQTHSEDIVAYSDIDAHIQDVQDKLANFENNLMQDQDRLAQVEETISELTQRWEEAQKGADWARLLIEQMKDRGVDSLEQADMVAFEERVNTLMQTYRQAQKEVQALRFGTYPQAQIEWGTDYLQGRYIENGSSNNLTVEYGLSHFEALRDVLAAKVGTQKQALDDLRSDLTRLQGIRNAHQAQQDHANRRRTEAQALAKQAVDEVNRLNAEAYAAEVSALEDFSQAMRLARQASGSSKQWISEASERTRELSLETRNRSAFSLRTDDQWIPGHIGALAADTLLAQGGIHVARFKRYTETARVLGEVSKSLALPEPDVESLKTMMADARNTGKEVVRDALDTLEQVHREVGGHWTVTAQEAGAVYLLVLLGEPNFKRSAIDAYRAAIQGREDKPYADEFISRLNYLEGS